MNPWNEFVKRYYRAVQEHPVAERARVLARMYRTKKDKLRPRLMSGRPSTPRGDSYNRTELQSCMNHLEEVNQKYLDCSDQLMLEIQKADRVRNELEALKTEFNNAISMNVANEQQINEENIKLRSELNLLKNQEAECAKRMRELQLLINKSTKQVATVEAQKEEVKRVLSKRLAELEQAITACKARAEAAEARIAELQDAATRSLAVEARMAELQQAIAECTARAEAAEARVVELSENGKVLLSELQKEGARRLECMKRAETAEARVAQLLDEGTKLQADMEAAHAELQRTISTYKARAEAAEAQVLESAKHLTMANARVTELVNEAQKRSAAMKLAETRVAELTRDRKRLTDSITLSKQQRADLKKKLKICEKTNASLRDVIKKQASYEPRRKGNNNNSPSPTRSDIPPPPPFKMRTRLRAKVKVDKMSS